MNWKNLVSGKISIALLITTAMLLIGIGFLLNGGKSEVGATTWPTSWTLLDDDSNIDCNNTQRNVLETYYNLDSGYLYLRMNLEGTPNFNDTLYKWFLDAQKDAFVKGQSINNYEYLVIAYQGKIYQCSSTAENLNQCSEITDTNKLNYRVDGNNVDMRINLSNYGPVKSVWWITDANVNNINQQPSGKPFDWPDRGGTEIPFFPLTYCGDGEVNQPSEQCDDGNNNSGDGCSATCQTEQLLTWYLDSDNDTYGDPTNSTTSYTQPAGYVSDNNDCNDTDAAIHPGATEICNGVDDDCDGSTDEGFNVGQSCTVGIGQCQNSGVYVCTQDHLSTECNAQPGTPSGEVCDNLDNDCDGETDENLTRPTSNQNGLCVGNIEVCEAGQWGPSPNNYIPTDEICDGQNDENCDGSVDEGCNCVNGATRVCGPQTEEGECAFGTQTCVNGQWGECVGAVYPSEEICDALDNDCDGTIDNDNVCSTNYYCDYDSDSYISSSISGSCNEYDCVPGDCSIEPGNDCDDDNGNINPGATEICNGIDDNCNGEVDEGGVCEQEQPPTGGTVYYTLSVSKTGNGSGVVVSNVGGINCGSNCADSFAHGTTVTLTATPDENSTFEGWSGACSGTSNTCAVAMYDMKSVVAEFKFKPVVLGEATTTEGEVLGEATTTPTTVPTGVLGEIEIITPETITFLATLWFTHSELKRRKKR